MKKIFIVIVLFPVFLFPNFIGMNSGARSLAMGNAYTALSDESIAIFYNPAGLARINQFHLKVSRQNLFGISDLYSDMISIALPTPVLRTGFAFQKINLVDAYSEQIAYLSSAGIIKPNQIPIRFGFSLKYESAKVENYDGAKNPKEFDLDMGLIVDFNENLFFGYSMKNILEPKFKFISDGDKLKTQQSIGLCYKWRSAVHFLADHVWTDLDSQWNFGSEIWFFNVFAARLGLFDESLTAGFGLRTKTWSVDSAVLSHEELGSTYRISFGFKYGTQR